MTYSDEEAQRPVSGGFTRAELETMPDSAVAQVMRGLLTKADWLRQQEAARTAEAEAAYSTADRPAPAPSQTNGDPYQVTAWGQDEYDFVTPSGQRCRMRNLNEEMLLEAGILDKITRLPGLVMDGPVRQGQGKPPAADGLNMQEMMKNPDGMRDLLATMNTLISVVVVQPKVVVEPPQDWVSGTPLPGGAVLVGRISLGDRMAIMERAMGGVMKLDNFRS